MHGYMNAEALTQTIKLVKLFYWSRSRKCLWHKGGTSGLVQRVREMRIDDDQDCIWLRVDVEVVPAAMSDIDLVSTDPCCRRHASQTLQFTERQKVFDPKTACGDAP